jgi:hypothetical protein
MDESLPSASVGAVVVRVGPAGPLGRRWVGGVWGRRGWWDELVSEDGGCAVATVGPAARPTCVRGFLEKSIDRSLSRSGLPSRELPRLLISDDALDKGVCCAVAMVVASPASAAVATLVQHGEDLVTDVVLRIRCRIVKGN